ncbi:MAG: alginate export family protein [Terriglobia bacterium]
MGKQVRRRCVCARAKLLFAVGVLLVGARPSFAQSPPAEPLKLGTVTVQGSVRERVEGWDWFQDPAYENSYIYPGTLIRLSFSQQREALDWKFELGAPVLLDLPNDAIAPSPQGQLGLGAAYFASNHNSQNTAMIFPKQAYLRFKHLGGSKGQSLQVGRFEFFDGGEATPHNATLAALKKDRIVQRLIGNFGFTNIERSFDGFHYNYSAPKLDFTAVGSIPTRGVFQTDGWGWLHTGFLYTSLTGQVMPQRKTAGEWRVFAIYYDDWRHVLKSDDRTAAARAQDMGNIRIGTFGGHYLQTVETPAGALDFLSWGAVQTGSWGVLTDRAGAFAGEAGVQPNVARALHPWLRAGYFYGSGDGNASDNKQGTFFQLLPTPRVYARFPFFNMMNNEDGFLELMLRPAKTITLRSDIHALRLASATDDWYLGGGAFQPQTFGFTGRPSNGARSLATLYDTSFDYQVGAHVSLGLYYGYAEGKSVIRHIYPHGADGQLAFIEATYRF